MSQIKTTEIEGDVAVGRHVTAGGNATIQGHASVKKNLKVEGWLEAKNIKGVNKGLFAADTNLYITYPHPENGWFAGVAATDDELSSLGVTLSEGKSAYRMYVGWEGEWQALNKLYEINVDIVPLSDINSQLTDNQTTLDQLSGAIIEDVELVRNWEGCGFRLLRNNGGSLLLAIPRMVLDPEDDANDLAGLITPTQARQIATNAQRINVVSATVNGHAEAIQGLESSLTVAELEAAQAQQASAAALSTADAAMSEALLATQEANKAKEDAAKHRADVGVYPFRGIEAWQFGGNAGLTVGETYLREEDAFLTVTDTHPSWVPLDAQSTGSPTEAASDVVVYEQGRNLLLETNKHLNRSGLPQWICRTGAVGNAVDPVDHEQFCDTIGPKRYSQDLWPSLKPSYGDLTGFNRLSPNTDPGTTWEVLLYPIRREVIRQGRTYTLQVTTYGAAIGLNAYIAKITGADPLCASTAATVETLANGARRHTFTLTATADGRPESDSDKAQYYVYFHPTDLKGLWNSFEVWDLKLEEGGTRSAWTPAPEDSHPNLHAEIKRGNPPYNQASHPKGDYIYRLGNALYHHEAGALVVIGGSNDYTDTDKQKLDALPSSTQLAEQFNAKQGALQSSEDVTVTDNTLSVTEKAKRALFLDRFNQAAGTFGYARYDEDGNFDCELNGLKLSYEEALIVDRESSGGNALGTQCHVGGTARTFYPIKTGSGSFSDSSNYAFAKSPNLEVIAFANTGEAYLNGSNPFLVCNKLRRILNGLIVIGSTTLLGLSKLEYAKIRISNDINLSQSPNLEYEALYDSITGTLNSYNSTARTITVHPTVYAKLTGDTTKAAAAALTEEEAEQWQALVPAALAKNISFATV